MEYSTPPPPDILEPPESPLRVKSTAVPVCDEDVDMMAEREDMETVQEGSQPSYHADHSSQSMYVKLFDEMISTVLDEEYLFTPREASVLRHILSLPYEPHYLLTRLLLRREGKVFPLSTLIDAYSGEIGEDGVKRAAKVLTWELDVPAGILEEEGENETTGSSESIAVSQEPTPRPSVSDSLLTAARPWSHLPTGLSEEEERTDPDLAEAIRRSSWAEENGRDVDEYLTVCDSASAGPSGTSLGKAVGGPPDRDPVTEDVVAEIDTNFSLAPRPSPPIVKLAHGEADLSLDDLMACMPIDDLRRVARARKIPPNLLATRESTMTALGNAARRQTTLDFGANSTGKGKGKARDVPVTPRKTSEHLVFAELLPLVGDHVLKVDIQLYRLIARVNLIFSRTPPVSTARPALLLPPILVTTKKRHYPDYGLPRRSRIWDTREAMMVWERAVSWEVLVSEAMGDIWGQVRNGGAPSIFAPRGNPMPRAECAKLVRKVFEVVWPIWQAMVAVDAPPPKDVGGDRFTTEHVLTRVVYKGAEALGVLHEYDFECTVLRALLAQRRWRRGKRGAWYERLALVLMTHYRGIPTAEERTAKLEDATQVCIDGLLDEDTHVIYRPGLSRRLTRLENKLNLPPEERHISFAELLTCETRELVAQRSSQNIGQVKKWDERRGSDDQAQPQQVGKSAWIGRDGEVTVEGWVLEWWEDQGYQGFHAESSILTTLFALLMWPVLFHPLPGAFETLYQTAPLDLGEDGFSRARRDLITARLAAMEDTATALEMLRETDSRERPRGTWAVGLSWDFGATELQEILECMGGSAMASICRVLSEEYRHRASGVPDLIVWNYPAREARFVEVKGPGDNLSATQKIWIDMLLSAGVPVEVCRVKDKDEEERRAEREVKKGKPNGSGSAKKANSAKAVSTPKSKQNTGIKRKSSASDTGKSRDDAIVIDDSDDEDGRRRKK